METAMVNKKRIEITPAISIVIPVYNASDKIACCNNCLKAQTIIDDIEIIFVDDGSTDDTLELLKTYANNSPMVTVIHQENRGVSSARNAGMRIARGEYVGFVDADDSFDDCMFEVLLRAAKRNNADISVAGFNIQIGNKWIKRCGTGQFHILNRSEALESFLCERLVDASVCTKLFKRVGLIELEFNEGLAYGEDRCFVFDALMKSNCIVHTDLCLYSYHCNPGSAMMSSFDSRRLDLLDTVAQMRKEVHAAFSELDEQAACYELRCCAKTYEELLVSRQEASEFKTSRSQLKKYLGSFDFKVARKYMLPRHYLAAVLLKWVPGVYTRVVRRLKYGHVFCNEDR